MPTAAVKATIIHAARQRHNIAATGTADFTVADQAQLIDTASSVSSTMTLLLGGIASISLIVGGIGIMNIMLVSVRERTREIGIRKAIGARNRDILLQFLLEALAISLLGGLIGVVIGVAISAAIGALAGWGFAFSPVTLLAATSSASRWASCSASGRHGRPRSSTPSPPFATNERRHPDDRTSPEPVPAGPAPTGPRPRSPSRPSCVPARGSGRGTNLLLLGAGLVAAAGIAFAVGRTTAPATTTAPFARRPPPAGRARASRRAPAGPAAWAAR